MRKIVATYPARPTPSRNEATSILRSCLSPESFWPPEHLGPQDSWLEHAPFAFWLIAALRPRVLVELGTHGGFSYFAFCQAVQRLQTETKCYAVDTWKGDEHAGFYGEEVYQQLRSIHDRHYSAFSTLIRSTFDEALPHFNDGSIDLLHIDGRHFYEDVRHDFATWRPKLSDHSVVLFHDINVRQGGFEVFKLWDELCREHPCFEFLHGHGLGVLGIGSDLPGPIRELFAAVENKEAAAHVRSAYSRLGSALSLQFSSDRQAAELVQSKAETQALRKSAALNSAEASRVLKVSADEGSRLGSELASMQRRVIELENELERAQHRAAEVQQAVMQLECDLASAKQRTAQLESDLTSAKQQTAQLESDLASAKQRTANLDGELRTQTAVTERRVIELRSTVVAREAELQAIKATAAWRLNVFVKRLAQRYSHLARFMSGLPRLFWRAAFLQLNSDKRQARQRMRDMQVLELSPLFDRAWYFQQYPDVRDFNLEPAWHYLIVGATEGRDPGPLFDSDWYLSQNPDVRASGINPLVHYLQYGAVEGRAFKLVPKGDHG